MINVIILLSFRTLVAKAQVYWGADDPGLISVNRFCIDTLACVFKDDDFPVTYDQKPN